MGENPVWQSFLCGKKKKKEKKEREKEKGGRQAEAYWFQMRFRALRYSKPSKIC